MASNSNVETLERFQNGYLGIIVNAPWYVINDTLHHNLNVSCAKDEIKRLSQRYSGKMGNIQHSRDQPHERSQNNTPTKKKITALYA